jgi:hypothetical protein
MAHGLGGTVALPVLLPVTLLASPSLAGAYLLVFGVGTVAAMALYSLAAGLLFRHAGARSPVVVRLLGAATGCGSMLLGGAWMYGAIA